MTMVLQLTFLQTTDQIISESEMTETESERISQIVLNYKLSTRAAL